MSPWNKHVQFRFFPIVSTTIDVIVNDEGNKIHFTCTIIISFYNVVKDNSKYAQVSTFSEHLSLKMIYEGTIII